MQAVLNKRTRRSFLRRLVPLALSFVSWTAVANAQHMDVRTGTFLPFRGLAIKNPYAVLTGDLNSDGRDDLVVATEAAPTKPANYKIRVYLQTADGSLAAPTVRGVGGSVHLAIADVNSDGRSDLLYSTPKGFAVLHQNNSGGLGLPVQYVSGLPEASGGAMVVADFSGDKRPDVAVTVQVRDMSPVIEVFEQTAAGTLNSARQFPALGYGLMPGDFNSDGLVDILGWSIDGFTVLKQKPGGAGFAPPTTYRYDAYTTVMGVTVGDVTGDGRDDVIVSQSASWPTIGVWAQDTSGSLKKEADYRAYQGATNLQARDFTGDGRIDVAVLNGSWEGLSLYVQKDDGLLADREIYPGPYSQNYISETYLAAGDLNGDGQSDAVALSSTGAFIFYHAPQNGTRLETVASLDALFASRAGSHPLRELTPDGSGNFYGIASRSGRSGWSGGAIFRVTPDGLVSAPADFVYETGMSPIGGMVRGDDGNFYGTTTRGTFGKDHGTIFRLTPAGVLTTVVEFTGPNGSVPLASLARGTDGHLYGTTSAGGSSGYGVVFRLELNGSYAVLHHFNGDNGREPLGRLTVGRDGLLYGTTSQGGMSDLGTLYSVSTTGMFTHLASFSRETGTYPYAGVTEAADGSFYGTASEGGKYGLGSIYRFREGVLTPVHSFAGPTGAFPEGGIVLGPDGSFYGTATGGGEGGYGTIFRLEASGAVTVLSAFGFWNGAYPTSTPVADGLGNLYGTTAEGGLFGDGSIYRIALDDAPPEPKPLVAPANLSTRGYVGTGNSVLIGGFIIGGSASKQVILRGIGPSLVGSGIPDALSDPVLTLFDGNGNVVAHNDDWRNGEGADLIESSIPPQSDREAAITRSLLPGVYTTVLSGANNTTGTALVELYDVQPAAASKLLNLSTRAEVSTGARALIGGFIIPAGPPAKILLRAIGPSLAAAGFPFPAHLRTPTLELRDGGGNLLASSQDWIRSAQKRQIVEAGLPPIDDHEPAIVITIPPGSYTAVVEGETGVGLVEIYSLAP